MSAADKVHNARAILADYRAVGDDLWSRFNPAAGRAGALWYYTRLTEILTDRLAGTPGIELVGELARTVEAIVALASEDGHNPGDEIADGRTSEAQVLARR